MAHILQSVRYKSIADDIRYAVVKRQGVRKMPKEKDSINDSAQEIEDEEPSATKLVLRLPGGLARKLKEQAEEEDKLVTEFAREVLRDYINGDLSYDEDESDENTSE